MFLYPSDFKQDFNKSLLEDVEWSKEAFTDHHEVAQRPKGKNP